MEKELNPRLKILGEPVLMLFEAKAARLYTGPLFRKCARSRPQSPVRVLPRPYANRCPTDAAAPQTMESCAVSKSRRNASGSVLSRHRKMARREARSLLILPCPKSCAQGLRLLRRSSTASKLTARWTSIAAMSWSESRAIGHIFTSCRSSSLTSALRNRSRTT